MCKPIQGGLSDLRMALLMNDARYIPFNTAFYIEVDNCRATVVRSKSNYDTRISVLFRAITHPRTSIYLSVEQLRSCLLPTSERVTPMVDHVTPTADLGAIAGRWIQSMHETRRTRPQDKPTVGMVEIKKEYVYMGERYKIGTLKMLAEAERYGNTIPVDTVFVCERSNQPVVRAIVPGVVKWRFLSDLDKKPHLIELNKLTIIKE